MFFLTITLFLLCQTTRSELIPRQLLFGDPKYSQVSLSPDGKRIGFIAPNEYGVSNVYVKCTTCRDAEQVTFENSTHISSYMWTGIPDIMLFTQDNNGDENTRLFKINISEVSFNQINFDLLIYSQQSVIPYVISRE
jgi:hypothetical protein